APAELVPGLPCAAAALDCCDCVCSGRDFSRPPDTIAAVFVGHPFENEPTMLSWKIAAVQMDCKLADRAHNLEHLMAHLQETARQGARLTMFPECALSGYCYDSKAEAWQHAEPIPGPSTQTLAAECQRLGTWAVVGMLETSGADLFNTAALLGPRGVTA